MSDFTLTSPAIFVILVAASTLCATLPFLIQRITSRTLDRPGVRLYYLGLGMAIVGIALRVCGGSDLEYGKFLWIILMAFGDLLILGSAKRLVV
jgi:hypothetical protein